MNLYKILLTHVAPKDHETAIKEYVIAETHKDVFEYLCGVEYTSWEYYEEEDRDKILWGHGVGALENDWADAYYGITEIDWELDATDLGDVEIDVLTALGIAKLI